MLDYEFGDGNYLVAVTYGPDSMALLDMMMKNGVSPVVCFVNYHFDETNDLAEQKLRDFCAQKNLRLEVCDTSIYPQEGREDFQKWSREVRYSFFGEMFAKYDGVALFLAHQQDDIIESYLLRKNGASKSLKYGLTRISSKRGMIIVRPLLNYTHEDLINYCDLNMVPYSLDSTRFEVDHTCSEIRKDVIAKLNEVERDQIMEEMRKRDNDRISFKNAVKVDLQNHDDLDIRSLMALTLDEYAETVINFVNPHSEKHISLSSNLLSKLREMCLNGKENDTLKLKGNVYFVKEYDRITLDTDGLNLPYSYVLEKPCAFSCPSFDLDFSMGAEDRHITLDDYPITIRSVLPQDAYVYGGYLAPVKKFLIASGISDELLAIWPVFLNKNGKIIYVPRFDKAFHEYHTSKLHIHVEEKKS